MGKPAPPRAAHRVRGRILHNDRRRTGGRHGRCRLDGRTACFWIAAKAGACGADRQIRQPQTEARRRPPRRHGGLRSPGSQRSRRESLVRIRLQAAPLTPAPRPVGGWLDARPPGRADKVSVFWHHRRGKAVRCGDGHGNAPGRAGRAKPTAARPKRRREASMAGPAGSKPAGTGDLAGTAPGVAGDTRHVYGPRPLGALLQAITRPAYRRRSPATAQMIAIGKPVSRPCARRGHRSPALFRRVAHNCAYAGPVAMELQHLTGELIARINTHLGTQDRADPAFRADGRRRRPPAPPADKGTASGRGQGAAVRRSQDCRRANCATRWPRSAAPCWQPAAAHDDPASPSHAASLAPQSGSGAPGDGRRQGRRPLHGMAACGWLEAAPVSSRAPRRRAAAAGPRRWRLPHGVRLKHSSWWRCPTAGSGQAAPVPHQAARSERREAEFPRFPPQSLRNPGHPSLPKKPPQITQACRGSQPCDRSTCSCSAICSGVTDANRALTG